MILQSPVRLLELVDVTGLEQLCRHFVAEHEIGVRVFSDDGTALVDAPHDHGLSDWVFRFPEGRRQYTDFVVSLKRTVLEPDEGLVRQDPVTDTRFLVVPITHEFDVLGRLVLGPYLPPDARDELPPTHLFASQMDPLQLARMRGALCHGDDDSIRSRAAFLTSALDMVCHAGWRALVTSKVHLESITEAFNDLQAANDRLGRANAGLAERNARLEELDKLKSTFLATVSHELRTPLTSVIGYGEMLLEEIAGPLNAEQRDYARSVVDRGAELLELIGGILDLSSIEQGEQQLSVGPVHLGALIAQATEAVRPQVRAKALVLAVDVAVGLPVVSGDALKLRQVLVNLLSNAVKFTPAGGRIGVQAVLADRRGRRAVVIRVADSGPGVPEEARAQIFEPFFQVDASSTRAHGGTGLGLSIVRAFVEMHGGVILVGDAPRGGALFTVVLPTDLPAP